MIRRHNCSQVNVGIGEKRDLSIIRDADAR